jgi:hypothetical protein
MLQREQVGVPLETRQSPQHGHLALGVRKKLRITLLLHRRPRLI